MRGLLEAQGITHVFGSGKLSFRKRETEAVSEFDFSLGEGESVGLLGQSGSGKTTVARILLRLLRPSKGVVRFDGVDMWTWDRRTLSAFRGAVQPVFQDPFDAFDPRRSVYNFLSEPLKYLMSDSGTARRERISEVLSLVHLNEDVLNRYPHQLSGGQRQRLALARALSVRPKVLILDEPTSALDVAVQAQVVKLLRGIQKETGVGYMLVAHDLALSRQLVDRVVILKAGRVVEEGPVAEVYSSPRDAYTRELLRASAAPWETEPGAANKPSLWERSDE